MGSFILEKKKGVKGPPLLITLFTSPKQVSFFGASFDCFTQKIENFSSFFYIIYLFIYKFSIYKKRDLKVIVINYDFIYS
jgi:hypothetical protein